MKKVTKKDRKKLLRQRREERGVSPKLEVTIQMSDRSYGLTKEPMRFKYQEKDNTWIKIPEHIVTTFYRIWE